MTKFQSLLNSLLNNLPKHFGGFQLFINKFFNQTQTKQNFNLNLFTSPSLKFSFNSNAKYKTKPTKPLKALKSPPQTKFLTLTKLKLTHSKGLFITLVVFSLLAFFSLNTAVLFQNSLAKAKANQDRFTSLITQALQTRNPDEQNRIINQISEESWDLLKPVANRFNLQEPIKDLIRTGASGLKKIVSQIDELKDYRVGSSGIVHKFQYTKIFTSDLQKLFTSIEKLRKELEIKFFNLGFLATEAIFATISANFELNNLINKITRIYNQRDLFISLLGGYNRQQVIVFTQNTGEARPTGGFTGSYIPLSITQGVMEIQTSQSIYYPDGDKQIPSLAHPVSWYYGFYKDIVWEQGVRNSNYFPCFPDTAKQLYEEFTKTRNGFANDVVILITPKVLLNLLPSNLEIEVGDRVVKNKNALLEEIEYATSIAPADQANPKQEIGQIFKSLAEKLPSILEKTDIGTFFQTLINSLEARDLQIWFKDSQKQDLWQTTGLAGNQTCQNQNPTKQIITPLITNLSTDKRNLITKNSFNIYAEPTLGGQTVNIKYTQTLPKQIDLQRPFNQFEAMTFVGLQLPSVAQKPEIKSKQALKLPFLRTFYEQKIEQRYAQKAVPSPEIKKLIQTSKNLYSEDGLIPGFVYTQPDGSQVLGIYVSDTQKTDVHFSFFVPSNQQQHFSFYSQPGLNQPSLGLGQGVVDIHDVQQNYYNNPEQLQSGIDLKLNSANFLLD